MTTVMHLLAATTTHLLGGSSNVAVVEESIAVIGVTVATAAAALPDGAAAREVLVATVSQKNPGTIGTVGLILLVPLVLLQATIRVRQREILDQLVVQVVTLQRATEMCPLDQALLEGISRCLAASLAIEATEIA